VLLYEPTASLDAASIRGVEELLLDYGRRNGVPLLWVSHDSGQLDRVAGTRLDMRPDGTLDQAGGRHGR
jgi:ABC-type iron transport system FetAB ATPase subunit